MSRTFKNYNKTWDKQYRRPRGRKQAIANGVRPGARPPDAWDDIRFSRECYHPWAVAYMMAANNFPYATILEKLRRKWKISPKNARDIAGHAMRHEIAKRISRKTGEKLWVVYRRLDYNWWHRPEAPGWY